MSDGRKYPFARTTAGIAATLTLGGLTFATASPASAAPASTDIAAAQARADRLNQQADAVDQRHDDADATLRKARTRLKALTVSIARQHRVVERLQAEVASIAVDEYDSGAGTSVTPPPMTEDSEALLAGVTVVSADTQGRTERIADTSVAMHTLAQRRATVGRTVQVLAARERLLERRAAVAESASRSADTRVASLQAQQAEAERKAQEKRVGPAVTFAMAQVGKAYVFGAAGPSAFDCSGLTMAAWAQAGVSLPHNSGAQYASGQHVSESELRPGDLVFYYSPISHVGMYIGNGQIVNALNPGAGIKVSGLHDMPYVGAVRPG